MDETELQETKVVETKIIHDKTLRKTGDFICFLL
jgi:hypothetical protein